MFLKKRTSYLLFFLAYIGALVVEKPTYSVMTVQACFSYLFTISVHFSLFAQGCVEVHEKERRPDPRDRGGDVQPPQQDRAPFHDVGRPGRHSRPPVRKVGPRPLRRDHDSNDRARRPRRIPGAGEKEAIPIAFRQLSRLCTTENFPSGLEGTGASIFTDRLFQ